MKITTFPETEIKVIKFIKQKIETNGETHKTCKNLFQKNKIPSKRVTVKINFLEAKIVFKKPGGVKSKVSFELINQ